MGADPCAINVDNYDTFVIFYNVFRKFIVVTFQPGGEYRHNVNVNRFYRVAPERRIRVIEVNRLKPRT